MDDFSLTKERQELMDKYILQKDIPGLSAGAIFVHDSADIVRGSRAYGCLKLAWNANWNCQQGYVAETFVFPAKVRNMEEWFKPYKPDRRAVAEQMHRLIDEWANGQ